MADVACLIVFFWVKCFDLPFSCIIIPSLSLFGGGKGEYVPNLWFRGYKGGKEDYVPDLRFPIYVAQMTSTQGFLEFQLK